MAWRKNDCTELEITGMTAEGSGVGRADGLAVFVPGTAVGDVLRVKLIKVEKRYAVGRVEAILQPSADRIPPDCAVAVPCGGCVYRHISYDAELRIKQQKVADALARIGGLTELPVRPIIGAPQPDHYRNKAQLPVGRGADGSVQVGFFAPHSHRIVPCGDCRLQPESFAGIVRAFLQWATETGAAPYDEETHSGLLRHLCIRQAAATGAHMVCVVANGDALPCEERLTALVRAAEPRVTSVVLNVNRARTNVIWGTECRTIWGDDAILDRLCGLEFSISPLSFYQVNHDQTERLYAQAAEFAALTGHETLLDLYCGTGTIGLSMANRAGRLIGAEIVPQAVADARRNAQRNGIAHAEFFCGDAADAADRLAARGIRPDVVVVDPPRKGCSEEVIRIITQRLCPARVVYVSCDPATLARDLKLFGTLGYAARAAVPVDMFPRTCHVETVVLLSQETNPLTVEVRMEVETGEVKEHPTYKRIQEYVQEKYGFKVHTAYIAEVKRMVGLGVKRNMVYKM